MTTSDAADCEQEAETPNTTATPASSPPDHSNDDKPETVRYDNGDVYEGELKDRTRHGKGLCRFATGDVYDGDWKDGKKHGEGTLTWADGNMYAGQWVDGEKHGRGTFKWKEGDIYEGEFENGFRHGRGVYRFANGAVYDGEWKDGEQHGTATYNLANGNVYKGEFENGFRHGRGVCRFADGCVYDGKWNDGFMHGTGTFTWVNGDVYEGEFEKDKFQGRGTVKEKNGAVFVGDWKEDKKHGKGIQRYASGNVYVGQFEDGAKHGRGILKSPVGVVYDGQWIEGKTHGWGTKTYASGNIYEGCWVEGKRHGKGMLKWKSGDVYMGEFVGGKGHGWGALTSASGDVYQGQWVEGKRRGNALTTKGREKTESKEGASPSAPGAGAQTNDAAPATGRELSNRSTRPEKLYGERQMRSKKSQQRWRKRTAKAKKTCEHCGTNDGHYKLRVCSGCNLALYCSAACQKAASGSHRRICNIISELPPKDADRLELGYDKEEQNDFDAGLRYATKYMSNLKHLTIDIREMDEDDAVKLSAKQLSSLLKSKRGALETMFCGYHNSAPDIFQNDAVWTNMCGLKQLHLHSVKLDDVQCLYKALYQQRNTLMVLCLPWMGIDWYNGNCRKTLALAVSFCKHLVKIDLDGCVLLVPDLKIMLQDLPNLRILSLSRQLGSTPFRGYLDSTCDILAEKCPTLQYLNLAFHDELSSVGIRHILERCVHLRSFHTTTPTLSFADIADLLDAAPQLMRLTLDDEIDATEEQLDAIVEATGGRTLIEIMGMDDDVVWNPDRISAKAKERYERQKEILDEIASNVSDPEVANEWAGLFEG